MLHVRFVGPFDSRHSFDTESHRRLGTVAYTAFQICRFEDRGEILSIGRVLLHPHLRGITWPIRNTYEVKNGGTIVLVAPSDDKFLVG